MSKACFQILIVDDDVAFRDFLAISLMELGHEVLTVTHIVQGLNLARKIPFDLLIVDGMLPDGDGVSFIAQVRAINPKALIYFLSAKSEFFTHPALIHKLQRELRVDKCHKKPVDTGIFLLEISALLSTHHKVEEFQAIELVEVLDDEPDRAFANTSSAHPPRPQERAPLAPQPSFVPTPSFKSTLTPLPSFAPTSTSMPSPGPPAPQPALQDWLQQQRGPFGQKINASLNELVELCRASSSWTPENPSLQRALTLAHQLHGSAGVFGFPEVGKHCAEIEGLLKQLVAGQRVSALADKVTLCLDAACRALPAEFRGQPDLPS